MTNRGPPPGSPAPVARCAPAPGASPAASPRRRCDAPHTQASGSPASPCVPWSTPARPDSAGLAATRTPIPAGACVADPPPPLHAPASDHASPLTHRLVTRVGNLDRREIATAQLLDQTDEGESPPDGKGHTACDAQHTLLPVAMW